MRNRLSLIALLSCLLFAGAAHADGESSLAVTDPLALRALEGRADHGFGLAQMLEPGGRAPIANDLFARSAMAPIRDALEAEFVRYLAKHATAQPNESIGVGTGYDVQLFDKAMLTSSDTRFVLAGIVNRMDRAYVAPETCGEIRLVYRLTRVSGAADKPPRLPMTLNLVLRAKEPGDAALTCAELAKRWLSSTDLAQTGDALADRLLASDGPLASVSAANIDRIETNLQIAHVPKSNAREFRTDYLQKVFRYDASAKIFREAPMENQIDRDRLLTDGKLGRAFKTWLLTPKNFAAFDRGTLLIPERYLAIFSLAATPVGFARSDAQPEFGLMAADAAQQGLFNESDVVSALQKATASGVTLQNIRSPAGFARRLNDITCGGCHQIRGIGGLHFPGVDWMVEKPSNTVTVPASPHFMGDQPRRRDIVTAMRDGRAPDFSRGFSDRPRSRGGNELAGSSLLDGWGATCYRRAPGKANQGNTKGVVDKSFASWTCAEGLACQQVGVDQSSDIGMCFVK